MSEQIEDVMALMEKKFDQKFDQPSSHTNASQQNFQNFHNEGQTNNNFRNLKQQEYSYYHQKESKINNFHNIYSNDFSDKKKIDTSTSIQIVKNHQLGSNQISSQNVQIENHQNDQPYKELDYRALQTKIQTVLKKNQKYKDLATTSRMTKNNSALMLSRFQEYQKKKEKSIQTKKNQLQNQEIKQLKAKPTINSKSQKIVDQCGYTPIFERFQKIIQSKKKKQEQLEENKKQESQKEYQKFMQEYKKHEKVPQGIRSYEEFFEEMVKWKQRAKKHTQEKKNQIQQKMKKNHPFKPQLNQNSVRLMSSKPRVPVHQRQIKIKQAEPQYSFAPKINKKRIK